MQVTLLTVHSQDHLMTAIAFTDLAKKLSIFIAVLITSNLVVNASYKTRLRKR